MSENNQQGSELELAREIEAIQIPSGDTFTLPAGTKVIITQSLGGTYTVATDHAGSDGAADAAHAATLRERAAALRRRAAGVRGRRAGSCTKEAVAVAFSGPAAAVALSIKGTTAAVALPFQRKAPRPRPEAPLSLRRLRRETSEAAEVWRRLGLVVGVVERRLTCGCFTSRALTRPFLRPADRDSRILRPSLPA